MSGSSDGKLSEKRVFKLLKKDPPDTKRKKITYGDNKIILPLKGDIIQIVRYFSDGEFYDRKIYLVVDINDNLIDVVHLSSYGGIANESPDLNRSNFRLGDRHISTINLKESASTSITSDYSILNLGSYDEDEMNIKRDNIVWLVLDDPDEESERRYEGISSIGSKVFYTERKARKYIAKKVQEELDDEFNEDIKEDPDYSIKSMLDRINDDVRVYDGTNYTLRALKIK